MVSIVLMFVIFFALLILVWWIVPVAIEKINGYLRNKYDHRDRGLGIRHGAIINKKNGKIIPQQRPML
jgi:predicted secreted protein